MLRQAAHPLLLRAVTPRTGSAGAKKTVRRAVGAGEVEDLIASRNNVISTSLPQAPPEDPEEQEVSQ